MHTLSKTTIALTLLITLCQPCQANVIYAVDDIGSDDSQLVRMERNGDTFSITNIGMKYRNADIEGISFLPGTDKLYAVGGENGRSFDKTFYIWDINTGLLTSIGTIGGVTNPFAGRDIIAAAFRPTDSTFWISVEDAGLYEMNINTLGVTLRSDDSIFTTDSGAEGLAWSADGQTLLASAGSWLYDVNYSDGSTSALHKIGHSIGGLGFDFIGNLYATDSENVTQLTVNGGSWSHEHITSELPGRRDIEAITAIRWVVPEPATLSLLTLGGLAMVRRRHKA